MFTFLFLFCFCFCFVVFFFFFSFSNVCFGSNDGVEEFRPRTLAQPFVTGKSSLCKGFVFENQKRKEKKAIFLISLL